MISANLGAYGSVLVFMAMAFAVAAAAAVLPFLVARSTSHEAGRETPYECGFDAFSDARAKVDVRFCRVAILFIVFDLEIAFLFPWAATLGVIGWVGFASMMVFLGVLTVGLAYEWIKGALAWD